MNVLSLFDGISCGQLALQKAGIDVENYFASEVDKFAIKVTQKNFPRTIFLGDCRNIDYSKLPKISLLIGGSPCQDLSRLNQKKDGLKGEKSKLFWEFIRAKNALKPKKFLFENVRMKKIEESKITEELECYPIEINSNLFSAQNRQRLYWTNILPHDFDLYNFIIIDKVKIENKNLNFSDICEKNNNNFEFIMRSNYLKNFKLNLAKFTANKNIISSIRTPMHASQERGKVFNFFGKINCLLGSDSKLPKMIFYQNQIRKITPLEYERLQTIPDNYTSILSKSKRYDEIGNAWTIDVISYIFDYLIN